MRFLYRRDGQARLVGPGLLVFGVTLAIGLVAATLVSRPRTDEERARSLSRNGNYAHAEAIYVDLLRDRPTVPLLVAFVSNHTRALAAAAHRRSERRGAPAPDDRVMDDDAVEALFGALPADLRVAARFVADPTPPPAVKDAIAEGAARTPPVPWYNHLLAEEALERSARPEAATLFMREGLAFPERRSDIARAMDLWVDEDDWDEVARRLADPAVRSAVEPDTLERVAIHDGDWKTALKWFAVGWWRTRLTRSGLFMSGVAALAWGFFCARLGKLGQHPVRRTAFYLAAFALGVLSVAPTFALIAFEEAKLHLVETGNTVRDLLFYVFGVGLREEASKLAMFAVLLPVLRKWGDKLDVLICGAFVGLGFAAEENLGYLAGGDLHTGLGRFLTANFLHMSMTGVLATALDELVSDPERYASEFSNKALAVIGLHGAYDFLLSHRDLGGPYMAMVLFVFLARFFLAAVDDARRRVDRGISPLHAFVFAVAAVTGASAVYATVAVGPAQAAASMAEGLLGEAIIIFIFVNTLRDVA